MRHLGSNIAGAVIPKGLSPENLGEFITALTARNETALHSIPDVTSQIIAAGANAVLDTYVQAFRHVWIAAACFVAVAAIGRFRLSTHTVESITDISCSRIIFVRPETGIQHAH